MEKAKRNRERGGGAGAEGRTNYMISSYRAAKEVIVIDKGNVSIY